MDLIQRSDETSASPRLARLVAVLVIGLSVCRAAVAEEETAPGPKPEPQVGRIVIPRGDLAKVAPYGAGYELRQAEQQERHKGLMAMAPQAVASVAARTQPHPAKAGVGQGRRHRRH